MPTPDAITLDEAANVFGISPVFMQQLVDQGVVPAGGAGPAIELNKADAIAVRDERERRHAGLAEIARVEESLGITY